MNLLLLTDILRRGRRSFALVEPASIVRDLDPALLCTGKTLPPASAIKPPGSSNGRPTKLEARRMNHPGGA
tara:strand:- start:8481 stop:8693 length:213 start_codon:yes stop_codon:yes gene_type:complete